jgi:hypothetical protein
MKSQGLSQWPQFVESELVFTQPVLAGQQALDSVPAQPVPPWQRQRPTEHPSPAS